MLVVHPRRGIKPYAYLIAVTSGVCWCTILLAGVKVKLFPQMCVKVIVLGVFCVCNGKTSTVCHQWTRWGSPSKQGSYSATVSTGCDKRVCTRGTLRCQHYITTSKEYLTNSHILWKSFELAFFCYI